MTLRFQSIILTLLFGISNAAFGQNEPIKEIIANPLNGVKLKMEAPLMKIYGWPRKYLSDYWRAPGTPYFT